MLLMLLFLLYPPTFPLDGPPLRGMPLYVVISLAILTIIMFLVRWRELRDSLERGGKKNQKGGEESG